MLAPGGALTGGSGGNAPPPHKNRRGGRGGQGGQGILGGGNAPTYQILGGGSAPTPLPPSLQTTADLYVFFHVADRWHIAHASMFIAIIAR